MHCKMPAVFKDMFQKYRYKVAYGGRGGGRSWTFAQMLLIIGAQKPLRVLCAREMQKSIKDSVHRVLADQIDRLGLTSKYHVTHNEIKGTNGTLFIFTGLKHNITNVKSIEGVDICWVEEAEKVSQESWDVLIPTIRKEGSEIWISFNPNLEDDPTYQKFILNTPPSTLLIPCGWEDNPFFPEVLKAEKDHMYATDPERARHVWGGECLSATDAQILKDKWIVEHFEIEPHFRGPYLGADWGFSQDPTVLMEVYVDEINNNLLIRHETWGIGIDNDDLEEFFDKSPNARTRTIRADSARPETISHMVRRGFDVIAVEKWKGSVEDGISHLRGYNKIIIHPDCPHMQDEAKFYSYKVDKLTGDVTRDIVDKWNHCVDALRYSLEPMITRSSDSSLDYL